MEKKKKKPRLKTKLQKLGIIASLVAILVSSVLCIPSGAVDADDTTEFEGHWAVDNADIHTDASSGGELLTVFGYFTLNVDRGSNTLTINATQLDVRYFIVDGEAQISYIGFWGITNTYFNYPWARGTNKCEMRDASTSYGQFVPSNINFTSENVTSASTSDGTNPYFVFRSFADDNTPPPEPTEPPPPPPPEPTTMIDDILKPFTEVGAWIATFVTALLGIFYNVELGKLTFCGVLSIAVLGFAVMFLLIRVIENFTHFRS